MPTDLSFIIPVYNEVETLVPLARGIVAHVPHDRTHELIFVDDGSQDGSWEALVELARGDKNIRAVRLAENVGKSAALNCGLALAQGRIVFTMDSDLQDDPAEIPRFIETLEAGSHDLVCGWRKVRNDRMEKRLASGVFNRIVRLATGVPLHDQNIGYKCFTQDVARSLRLGREMHRYVPVLAHLAEFSNQTEIAIRHHPRRHGKTKYGMRRYWEGLRCLLYILIGRMTGSLPAPETYSVLEDIR